MNMDVVHTVIYSLMAVLSVAMYTRERKLREEIETMRKLRDAQVDRYKKALAAANVKVKQLEQEGKGLPKENIEAHRVKLRSLLQSQVYMTWTLIGILGAAVLNALLR